MRRPSFSSPRSAIGQAAGVFGLVASLLCCALAAAQTGTPATQFIASRQAEVERLGLALYSTHLSAQEWSRHEVHACPFFQHHAFARFDDIARSGAHGHFLALYDLDHPAAPSAGKPWRGGILLLRLYSGVETQPGSTSDAASLIAAFNHVLQQERESSGGSAVSVNRNAVKVAECFTVVSGQEPLRRSDQTASNDDDPAPSSNSTILIPLVSGPGFSRTQSVSLDRNGLITDAGVAVHRVLP